MRSHVLSQHRLVNHNALLLLSLLLLLLLLLLLHVWVRVAWSWWGVVAGLGHGTSNGVGCGDGALLLVAAAAAAARWRGEDRGFRNIVYVLRRRAHAGGVGVGTAAHGLIAWLLCGEECVCGWGDDDAVSERLGGG